MSPIFNKSIFQILIVLLANSAYSQSSLPLYLFDETNLNREAGTAIVQDLSANGGSFISRPASAPSATAWFGPYSNIKGGNYLVNFRLKVASNSSSSFLLRIDIVSSAGNLIYGHLDLKPDMFKVSNEWQLFSIPVSLIEDSGGYECRGIAFQSGITDISLDYISIVPGNVNAAQFGNLAFSGPGPHSIPNGKFGVGTIHPTLKFDVSGQQSGQNAGVPSVSGSTQNGIMRLHADAATWGEVLDFGINVMPSYAWIQSTNRGNLSVNYTLALNPNGGNIGIGTSDTKGFKLAVAGSMVAESVKVQLHNSWIYPDYVFKPSYKLPSLQEVESFIEKNHHLPEIPSEKEAKANGLDLGEMNAKLLKKIEELTLYLIDQNRQMKALKDEVAFLKEKIK